MKKSITLLLMFLFVSMPILAQDTKKEAETVKTKMDVFASKTGTIMKFVDYNLSGIKGSYGTSTETRIRKITSGTVSGYFFQIEKAGQYGSSKASIDYNDLLELIKALKTLKTEVDIDITTSPDYLENKFTTVDWFQVGYFINKGKATWYLKLEKYGSDSSVFIQNSDLILVAFEEGKAKIEQLKQ